MPEARKPKELTELGTVVKPTEVFQKSELPSEIKTFLDPRGKVKVRFKTSGHVADFSDPLVQDYLYVLLMEGKQRPPTKGELESYTRRVRLSALAQIEDGPDAREVRLWNAPVVLSLMQLMYSWYYGVPTAEREKESCHVTSLKKLRTELVDIAKANEWDYDDWPRENWFRGYLESFKDMLEENNITLGFEVTGPVRKIKLGYKDPAKIPEWKPEVTR